MQQVGRANIAYSVPSCKDFKNAALTIYSDLRQPSLSGWVKQSSFYGLSLSPEFQYHSPIPFDLKNIVLVGKADNPRIPLFPFPPFDLFKEVPK
jgi:hypothetical protein